MTKFFVSRSAIPNAYVKKPGWLRGVVLHWRHPSLRALSPVEEGQALVNEWPLRWVPSGKTA